MQTLKSCILYVAVPVVSHIFVFAGLVQMSLPSVDRLCNNLSCVHFIVVTFLTLGS